MDKNNGFQTGDYIVIVQLHQIPKQSMQRNRKLWGKEEKLIIFDLIGGNVVK